MPKKLVTLNIEKSKIDRWKRLWDGGDAGDMYDVLEEFMEIIKEHEE